MINLREKESDEKLENMLEELYAKAIEKSSKPKLIITYNITPASTYNKSRLEKVDDVEEIIQRISELHEDSSEIHINVDI